MGISSDGRSTNFIMRKLIKLGVDGLITGYPDLGTKTLAELQGR